MASNWKKSKTTICFSIQSNYKLYSNKIKFDKI